MTQRTRPMTVHHLMAHAAGMPMSCKEFLRWKNSSPTADSPQQKALRAALARNPDRPLDDKEQKGLRVKRSRQAERDRVSPARIQMGLGAPVYQTNEAGEDVLDAETGERVLLGHMPPLEEKTVPYYRRAVARFERWVARAERLGLDKGRPPASIRQFAMDVVSMVKDNQGQPAADAAQ